MEFYAHKREDTDGRTICQTVKEHSTETAKRAAECLRSVKLEKTGYLAGLLHDMGKYTDDFQRYLFAGDNAKRGSVIHTFQGCRYMMEKFHNDNVFCAELIAYAIGAHHGFFDCVDATRSLGLKYRSEKPNISYESAVKRLLSEIPAQEISELFTEAAEETDRFAGQLDEHYRDNRDYAFETGLLVRLILSAVIEGDRHNTAAFFMGDNDRHIWPESMTSVWSARLNYLEEKLKHLPQDTPISETRHLISDMCKESAARAQGIVRLNVPTGGGKTLGSLRYALTNAMHFNKRRLIFASPLLSILEQNAKVIRDYVGNDRLILEHHSNVVQSDLTQDELDERELLTQNWNAPIVITTLVQLLNTMFDGKTTSIRRFHALCNSVIVIDEVQTVPAKMLTLFNLAIQFLSEQCGATIVLCSATQPELEAAAHPLQRIPGEIVSNSKKLRDVFRRTELSWLPNRRLEEIPDLVIEKMAETDSLLVICNKKSEAAYLFERTKSTEYKSFHLSAAMCMQNRRDVLAALQDSLSRHEKVLCIATQVIEAGVDISFGAVLRLAAGLDSIVQAAGRCNRSGESRSPRPVYVVNCTDENLSMLRDIRRGKDASLELAEAYKKSPGQFDNDLFSNESIRYYYKALYRDMADGEQDYSIPEQKTTLFDLMSTNEKYADEKCIDVDSYFLRQAFKTAGRYFAVFDEDTTDVIVPYGERGKHIIAELCSERCRYDMAYRAAILKEAGNYTVNLYSYQKKQLEQNNALIAISDNSVLVLKEGFYDDMTGLTDNSKNQVFMEV